MLIDHLNQTHLVRFINDRANTVSFIFVWILRTSVILATHL
jgi:hypothetical protein